MDQSDLDRVLMLCLGDLDDFSSEEAAKSIISRVYKLDRASRMAVLMGVLEEADAATFWRIFLYSWSDFEFPHRWENLIDLLRGAHRFVPPYGFMDPADQKYFDNLPDSVTIYRGFSGPFPLGASWTTDRDIAEWFARRFAENEAHVVSGTIRKQDIWAVFTDRKSAIGFSVQPIIFRGPARRLRSARDVAPELTAVKFPCYQGILRCKGPGCWQVEEEA